jgi:hypothetical protein
MEYMPKLSKKLRILERFCKFFKLANISFEDVCSFIKFYDKSIVSERNKRNRKSKNNEKNK